MRIGQGYDIHRLISGRTLLLGGVDIPFEKGEDAHSDGDVLIHAVIDALLGACALGDIGTHFPSSDPKYKNADSRVLLKQTIDLCRRKKYEILNIDSTVILEKPKLSAYIPQIQKSLADILNVPLTSVSVKAKTKEKQDSTGKGAAVEAISAVLMIKTS